MPGGDRTGPMGCGPMTGRGTGYCANGPINNRFGGGFAGGFGCGRGRRGRTGFFSPMTSAFRDAGTINIGPKEVLGERARALRAAADRIGAMLGQTSPETDKQP